MKIYLAALLYNDFRAGSPTWNRLNEREQRAVIEVRYILDSFHYINKERVIDRIRKTGRKIFLDSGAFSAFTQGVEINLRDYIEFCHKNKDFLEQISVLDAIGDPDKTYRNLVTMEKRGIVALPCYHYGEDEAVIEFYANNYEYITIGGMVPISGAQLKVWLDRVWARHLIKSDGTPKTKVHGFGLTSVSLMARYPWYSVDSSSWVQSGGIGNIFLPHYGMIGISEHAPSRKIADKHVDNLPDEHRKVVYKFIEDLGFDIQRLRESHLSRKCFNIVAYEIMMDTQLKNKTFKPSQPTLF